MEENPNKATLFAWADTPWTVAALLGAWGVMIGIEEFFLANLFMVLAGISCTARLARDCFTHRRRRVLPFILWSAIIAMVIGVDIHLTARKRVSSESKAREIPHLNTEIENLNATIKAQSAELSNAQGHTDQRIADIQEENRELRSSIDKKDAALVAIAKQQYDLNFVPQVYASTSDSKDEVKIANNGKTNIQLYGYKVDGQPQKSESPPLLIVPGAYTGLKINEDIRKVVVRFPENPAPLECIVYLQAFNGKRYEFSFTWYFEVRDGAVARSYAVDHPIVPSTWSIQP